MSAQATKIDDRDLRSLARMMIILRVISAGAALALIAFLTGAGVRVEGGLPVAGLLLLVFPLSAVWWLMLKCGRGLVALVIAQLVADVAVETGVVYYTGGIQSHFTLLYLVTILVASICVSLRGSLAVASLAAVSYMLCSAAQYRGLGDAGMLPEGSKASAALSVGLQVAFFYFIAVLSGYLSKRLGIFGARLRSAATEIQRMKTDTHSIVESMSSGFIVVDSDMVITEFNRSASGILGIDPKWAVGRAFADVFGGVSPDLVRKLSDAATHGKSEGRGEVVAVVPSGKHVPLGVSVSLLEEAEGEVRGAILVFQDLTEVKRMAERMRLADRLAALGELSAAIAHEIRTPLASISGSIEMLRDSLDIQGENRRLIQLVVKESERLKAIIDHFLQFARPRPSRLSRVVLNAVILETVYMVRNHPSFKQGMKVEALPSPSVDVWVDEETIRQVFYNLALNAIEALGPGGTLRIGLGEHETADGGRYACVRFEDDGAGIATEDIDHIFEPFFTRKRAGTGLGLAIASKIIEEHGGKIEVESTKGVGTVATVYLPLDTVGTGTMIPGADAPHVLVESA